MAVIRILVLADTHLGYDLPFRPRVQRRRRGHDFFDNFRQALEPARSGDITCVIHGGDLLYRSRVPADLVAMAFEGLHEVAARGTPVYLVPGNHERSEIPFRLLAQAPGVHIFDRPRTFLLETAGVSLGLTGFPYIREDVRGEFPRVLSKTGWRETAADLRILCMHQCVEGARVGPSDFTFRWGPEVIRAAEIPADFRVVVSGHIHKAQVLTRDLSGRSLPAPVIYPGSIERTSFAERNESKGFFVVELDAAERKSPRWDFHKLYARPMVEVELRPKDRPGADIRELIRMALQGLPSDAVVKLRVKGDVPASMRKFLTAASLRNLARPSMNVSVVWG